jgi:serine/threonine-protein kinase
MGAVYKARQKSLDRIVALKILPAHAARDEAFTKRFVSEARTVARLNHENVIAGIDVGEANGVYYFAMEYVDGTSLARIIETDGPLPERRAVRIALQIARALEHAHKHGLVHRDVKPGNVLVANRRLAAASVSGPPREEGAAEIAKLCDLGLAKSKTHTDTRTGSSDVRGLPLGTPHYLSPEQARGEADVDIRSDIYSLGATLYHALTGSPPFEGGSPMVLMTKHLTEDPVPPRKRNPDVSKAASDLVLQMMAKEKEERHQTPQELVSDLESLLEGKPARERRPRVGASSARRERRRPRLASAEDAGGAGGRTPRDGETDEPSRRGASSTRSRPTSLRPPREAQAASSGPVVLVILGILLGSVVLWVLAKGAPTGPTVQQQQDADRALGFAKVNLGLITQETSAEDKAKVRGQLERIVRTYQGTLAASEAARILAEDPRIR